MKAEKRKYVSFFVTTRTIFTAVAITNINKYILEVLYFRSQDSRCMVRILLVKTFDIFLLLFLHDQYVIDSIAYKKTNVNIICFPFEKGSIFFFIYSFWNFKSAENEFSFLFYINGYRYVARVD